MKNIITIQHTRSEQHINKMIGSLGDFALTETGVSQAQAIGNRLFAEVRDKDFVMYSSDLKRARQTAEIVAACLEIEPIFAEELREFDLGEANGKSKEWARSYVQCPLWEGTVDWAKNIYDRPFIGAESKVDVWNRLERFLDKIIASDDENIIIVSHDGTLSILYALWLRLDIEMLNHMNISGKSGGVSFLREDNDGNRAILRLNDMSYMNY